MLAEQRPVAFAMRALAPMRMLHARQRHMGQGRVDIGPDHTR